MSVTTEQIIANAVRQALSGIDRAAQIGYAESYDRDAARMEAAPDLREHAPMYRAIARQIREKAK